MKQTKFKLVFDKCVRFAQKEKKREGILHFRKML